MQMVCLGVMAGQHSQDLIIQCKASPQSGTRVRTGQGDAPSAVGPLAAEQETRKSGTPSGTLSCVELSLQELVHGFAWYRRI